MPKLIALGLEASETPLPEVRKPSTPSGEPFRYAFLALLAFNVFLATGGASFALLYFYR